MNTLSLNAASFRKRFERFAEEECKNLSPLYYSLSKQIAEDEELLRLCAFVKEGQPVPNAFLAAVHFYILKNKTAPLAQYYPSVNGRSIASVPFNLFKAFVQEHREGIIHLLQHRIVQANVITRCNYLLPIFSNILSSNNKPATIIDIGASAGLNVNFDRYEYYYDDEKIYGDSRIKLHCQIKEGKKPIVNPFNNSIRKVGIDQHPIDLTNADDLMWLQALIWPDQRERFLQLENALEASLLSSVQLIAGSTITDFKKVIEVVDSNETLIIYATHVLYQFSDALLHEFYDLMDRVGQQRDFFFISAEATQAVQLKYRTPHTAVVLTTYNNGQKQETLMAETNGHGNWIKWKETIFNLA